MVHWDNSRFYSLAPRVGTFPFPSLLAELYSAFFLLQYPGESVSQYVKSRRIRSRLRYEKYHVFYGGAEEERKTNYTDMVNKYYDLVTSFYEFGWGESFHFAHRFTGESLRESIKRHEHFLALQLGLKAGHKDVELVTTERNCSIQQLNHIAGVDRTCDFVKADFMKMPFPDCSFDAVYAIEATCHAPDAVIWSKDLAASSPVPWYLPLDKNHFSLSSFRLTAIGRFFTRNMVKTLEFVGLAPKGSQRVQDFLEKAAEGLVEGGR
ncbi:hypothetical protein GH714_017597 [Hevea brasiliensis]|uniref:Methyltransferase n=1 Tax=Hevea brasiliensis TaxID=3981 RepID=A0A6A6N2V0_HEVBR|nr:hypothetical protein GH714_017597 [Hevea brasiliensis]